MRATLLMCKKLRGGNSLLLLTLSHEHQGSVLDWVNDHHLNFLHIFALRVGDLGEAAEEA